VPGLLSRPAGPQVLQVGSNHTHTLHPLHPLRQSLHPLLHSTQLHTDALDTRTHCCGTPFFPPMRSELNPHIIRPCCTCAGSMTSTPSIRDYVISIQL
jgi:hypothetical protein